MEYVINVNCDNAAFGEDGENCGRELARILRELAKAIDGTSELDHRLYDVNGNKVGRAYLID